MTCLVKMEIVPFNLKPRCKLALLSVSMYLKQVQQLLLAIPNSRQVMSGERREWALQV